MATIKFGAQCDVCLVYYNDYDVGDIAWCNDCELDLCDKCAEKLHHSTIEQDEDRTPRHRRCMEDWWEEEDA